jgi:hypothetical protein
LLVERCSDDGEGRAKGDRRRLSGQVEGLTHDMIAISSGGPKGGKDNVRTSEGSATLASALWGYSRRRKSSKWIPSRSQPLLPPAGKA